MARPLTHQALTLFAGLALLGGVVACGGSAGNGIVPTSGSVGASGSSSVGGPSVSTADSGRHDGSDCDGHKDSSNSKSSSGHDDDGCTPAPTSTPANGGGGTTTTTTYQNIVPLTFYTDGSSLSFLITPVSVATVFTPMNSGHLATSPFTIPVTCAAPGGGIVVAGGERRSAVAASPTAPPTPTPTNMPVSSCQVVAYAAGSTTGIPVSGLGSIDGSTLIFAPLTPGPTYVLGTTYTFYVAFATTTTVTTTSSPSPSPSPSGCVNAREHQKGDRHEDDNGNHKDCGHHYGDDDHGDGGGHDH